MNHQGTKARKFYGHLTFGFYLSAELSRWMKCGVPSPADLQSTERGLTRIGTGDKILQILDDAFLGSDDPVDKISD